MTDLTFHWFLPTNGGDGRHVVGGGHGTPAGSGGRPASVAYLGQIARSAEQLGFEAALEGRHLRLSDAVLAQPPDLVPSVYFGGSSPAALDVAARHADVYLTWGEPPAAVAEKVRRVRELAARRGRDIAFGEGALPELARRGLWRHPLPSRRPAPAVPFGAPVPAAEGVPA